MPMTYANYYIRELAYVTLARDLIVLGNDVEVSGDTYSLNNRLSRRLELLKQELEVFLIQYIDEFNRINIALNKLLAVISREKMIQPDYLALYILLIRFQPNERAKKLHEDFKWITNKDGKLMECFDLLHDMQIDSEEEMMKLAYKLNEVL